MEFDRIIKELLEVAWLETEEDVVRNLITSGRITNYAMSTFEGLVKQIFLHYDTSATFVTKVAIHYIPKTNPNIFAVYYIDISTVFKRL